ncbi:MAG: hypothetical protein KatS3mg050_3937 [Litorilinea sp.]|nr:MAG: hypothetical protein KatS3mg050_3937 [Litorilinea sp.]
MGVAHQPGDPVHRQVNQPGALQGRAQGDGGGQQQQGARVQGLERLVHPQALGGHHQAGPGHGQDHDGDGGEGRQQDHAQHDEQRDAILVHPQDGTLDPLHQQQLFGLAGGLQCLRRAQEEQHVATFQPDIAQAGQPLPPPVLHAHDLDPVEPVQGQIADHPPVEGRFGQDHRFHHLLLHIQQGGAFTVGQDRGQPGLLLFQEAGQAVGRAGHHEDVTRLQYLSPGFLRPVDLFSPGEGQQLHPVFLFVVGGRSDGRGPAQPAVASLLGGRRPWILLGDAVKGLFRGLAHQVAVLIHHDFGDVGGLVPVAHQVDQGGPIGQQAIADEDQVEAAHRGVDGAQAGEFEHGEAGSTRLAVEVVDEDVGAGADQGHGAAQDGEVADGHQQLRGPHPELAAEGQRDRHHHHHDGGVVDKGAGHRHRQGQQEQQPVGIAPGEAGQVDGHRLQRAGAQ